MVFIFLFFWICLTYSVPKNLQKSNFEMLIIPQALNINNFRIKTAKSFNLHTTKKPAEYSLNHSCLANMYCLCFGDIGVWK